MTFNTDNLLNFKSDFEKVQQNLAVLKGLYRQSGDQTASARMKEKCTGAVYGIEYAENLFTQALKKSSEKPESEALLEELITAMSLLADEKHSNEKCGDMFDAGSLLYSAYMGRAFGINEVLMRLAPVKEKMLAEFSKQCKEAV